MRSVLLLLIRAYKLTLSPWFGPCCRFQPSCADYATEVIHRHGALKGGWLTLRRLGRCHPGPGGGSGYDPAPER